MLKKYISWGLWVLFFSILAWVINVIWYKPFDIDDFYERVLVEYGLEQPETLTRFQIWEEYGIDFYNDKLSDLSIEKSQERYKRLEKSFEMLRSYKRSGQTPLQLISTDILDNFLENEVHEHLLYKSYSYPINHINGAHLELPFFMVTEHTINKYSEAEDYIHRLNQFETYFGQLLQQTQARQDSAFFLPNFLIDKVLTQMSGFINVVPTQNILYTEFVKKVEKLPHLTPNAKKELYYEVRFTIEQIIYPTYRKMIQYLDEVRENNRTENEVGLWQIDRGTEYYFFMLKKYTNVDISPEELHEIGLAEIVQISTQIRTILDSLQFPAQKPVIECLDEIYQNPLFRYDSLPKSQLFTDIKQSIAELESQRHYIFEIQPHAQMRLAPTHAFRAIYAPPIYYESSSLDGNSPAICFLNMSNMNVWRRFEQKAQVCQDIFLGKHYPIAIQREANRLPTFRRIIDFEAFNRGWASYSLTLADEYGFFKTQYEKLGMWHLRLINAAMMVVDTGIHGKRWSRQEAINYMEKNTCLTNALIQYYVDYTIVFPARSCAYHTGNEHILKLRQEAKNALGKKFDIKEFHDTILENGSVPLDILSQVVNSYIKKTQNEKF
jgi:uncharacterized protein (DUF885 family)